MIIELLSNIIKVLWAAWSLGGIAYVLLNIVVWYTFKKEIKWCDNPASNHRIFHVIAGPIYWLLSGYVRGFIEADEFEKNESEKNQPK